jgi:acetyl esterase
MGRWLEMLAARQPMRRVVLDLGMHALAVLADRLPAMRQRMQGCRLLEDIAYAQQGGVTLHLDLLQPPGTGPHPVLLYFHGGAFAIGSKRTHRALAAAYAAQGYVVCNVDYRLAPKYPFPAALQDACAAWLWATGNVAQYGGDPQRMALAGESAGANLALAVALACCTARPEAFAAPLQALGARPAAVLLYSGFLQASEPQRYNRPGVSDFAARVATDAAHSYLGADAVHPAAQHALADPLCVVEALAQATLPPVFIAAGSSDPVLEDSRRLERALKRLKVAVSAHYYRGETHAFHVMFWRKQALRCWRDSFAFLRRQLAPAV